MNILNTKIKSVGIRDQFTHCFFYYGHKESTMYVCMYVCMYTENVIKINFIATLDKNKKMNIICFIYIS